MDNPTVPLAEWVESVRAALLERGYAIRYDIGNGVTGTVYVTRIAPPANAERLILFQVAVHAKAFMPTDEFLSTVDARFAQNDKLLMGLLPQKREKDISSAKAHLMYTLSELIGDQDKQAYREETRAVVDAIQRLFEVLSRTP